MSYNRLTEEEKARRVKVCENIVKFIEKHPKLTKTEIFSQLDTEEEKDVDREFKRLVKDKVIYISERERVEGKAGGGIGKYEVA